MKALMTAIALLGALCCGQANAQYYTAEPSGGLTIDYLWGRPDGFHLVVFQGESNIPEINNNCTAITASTWGPSLVNRKYILFNASSPDRKQVFNQLLLTQALGKKVTAVTFTYDSANVACMMFGVRTAP